MRHFAPTHRFSAYAYAALAGVLFHPDMASAVALGNIALQSSLGQPLRVVVPVALNAGENIHNSCLKLVRTSDDGAPQLVAGRISVERDASNVRLVVTTPRAVEEPAVRVSLQAGCGNTVRRDYVLLLDPQGSRADTMVASADIDEFKHYAGAPLPARLAQRAEVKPAPPRVEVASIAQAAPAAPSLSGAVDVAPAKTTFTPIAAAAPVAAAPARTQKPVPATPLVAAAPTPLPVREPVALTTVQPQGGFIGEAAAASFTRNASDKTGAPAAVLAASIPRAQAPVAEATLWTQTWPYVAIALSLIAIALTAFAKRNRFTVPAWGAPTVINDPKSTSGAANTFAHFGVMSEQVPPPKRDQLAYPTVSGETTYDASLDTLLEQIQDESGDSNIVNDNEINEQTIRKAWATLANESAVDIGTDSILKAIADAERELRISPPSAKEAAMDKALDDELTHESNLKR